MKPLKNGTILTLSGALLLSLLWCTAGFAQGAPGYMTRNMPFPTVELPAPPTQSDRNYLGLAEQEKFKIGEIKAPVVLVEIMSVYCPYCQKVAPLLDDVYRQIESSADLKGKIKMMTIGQGNSAYELDLFREKYKVPFPLFPDPKGDLSRAFMVPGTPTFIGAKLDGKGGAQEFFFRPGAFSDASRFLDDFAKAAGLR